MRKAIESNADAVILDLEDAVAAAARIAARQHVADVLDERAARGSVPGGTRPDLHVRIDRDGDGYAVADLEAVVRPGLDAIRLPKVESLDAVSDVVERLDRLEPERDLPRGSIRLYLTVESAIGVLMLGETLRASTRVVRAAIGTSDLLADLGAEGDDDLATLHIRSQMVLVSRAVGAGPPIDSVHTDLGDDDGLSAGATRARTLGFHGKSVIHPRQLEAVHAVFTPTADQLERARAVIDAFETAARAGTGGVAVDGRFIDAAVVARARALLDLRRSP